MNDDALILYYYKDGLTERERREIDAALGCDKTLALRYDRLCRELDGLVDDTMTSPPPRALTRWHASIDRSARSQRSPARSSRTPFHVPSFMWGTAVTATLVIGVGLFLAGRQAPLPPDSTFGAAGGSENAIAIARTAVPAAFSRGLQVHLRESRQDIARLAVAEDTDQALLIANIIEQNRLFERAADLNNSPELARVLRAFEPVLLQLAANDLAPQDAESLRAQLAFELNVMLSKLGRDEPEESQSI